MKRKICRTNSIVPSPIRSSKNQFNSAKGDHEAKTSEYAFFKKLKTDASHRFHSRPSQPEQTRFKLCDSDRERSSGIKNSSKELRFPVEDVTHVDRDVFLSPVVEVDLKKAPTTFGNICSTTRSMEEYNKTPRPKGTRTQHQDLFFTKRQKLHQWVTEISFPETKELCSKGYEFVSLLLSRLFPESNEDNSFEIPRSKQVLSNAKSKFPASPSSNFRSKNLHQMSTRSVMDIGECDPYLDNYSSTCWLGRSRERAHFDSPTGHAHNTLCEYNVREPSCELGGERDAITWIESDSTFNFPFGKYGYYSSSDRRKLDNFHYPDGSLLQRKERALLLGWDFKNVTNERNSPVISQSTELTTYRKSLTSWGDNHVWSLDDGFGQHGASGLCASPLICNHPSSLYSLPPPGLTSNFEAKFGRHYIEDKEATAADLDRFPLTLSRRWSFGRHYMEDKEDIAADLDHCPLTLSHRPSFGRNYIEEMEDIDADLDHFLSTLSQRPNFGRHYIEDKEDIAADLSHCPLTLSRRPSYLSLNEDSDHETTQIRSERYHDHETEALLSSKLDFDMVGRKCLSICDSSTKHYYASSIYPPIEFPGKEHIVTSHFLDIDEYGDCPDGFSEDIVNVQDWSSFYFRISLDRKMARPLLLDKSSWEGI